MGQVCRVPLVNYLHVNIMSYRKINQVLVEISTDMSRLQNHSRLLEYISKYIASIQNMVTYQDIWIQSLDQREIHTRINYVTILT